MPEMTSGFRVLGNEIVDARTGEPVSPADFNARSTPEEKDSIHRELVSRGAMTNQRGEGGSDLLEEEDAQLGDDAPVTAQPVAQKDAPQDAPAPATLPEPKTARPSLQHFMEVMKPRHPKVDDRELHRYWAQHYSDVDPKTLPTFETFLPAVKERNPTLSDEDARTYWEEHYGDFGAAEKNAPAPGFLGTAKDMGIKAAAGVVDVAQSAVGLASLASGGKAGEILRDLGWNPEEATKFLNSKTSEAQQAADQAVHDAKGFIETVVAYAQNPRAIAGGVAEAAPGIASMGLAARKAATMIAEKAAAAYGGLATAEGAAAASKAVEAAAGKLMWVSSGTEGALSAGQIADQAQGAGREYSEYLLPSLAGGAGTAAIGRAAGGLLGSAEIPMFTGSKAGAITGNFAARTAKSLFSEGFLEEMPQSAQEQVFQNLATGKPWSDGVPEAAASGAVIGAAMGGVMGGVQRPTPPPQEEELPEPQRQGPPLPQREGPQIPQPFGPNLPEKMGPFQPQAEGPQAPQSFGPTLPDALGPQLEQALGPSNEPHGPYRPTIKDVIAAPTLDEAIAATQGLINTFDVPNAGGPAKRPFIEPTLLPGATPVEPPLIQPGSAFSPRQEPTPEEPSLREKLNAERVRLEAMRSTQPVVPPATPEPAMPTVDDGARETATEDLTALQGKSEINEPVRDRVFTGTQLFGDGPHTESLLTQGFQALDREAQRVVVAKVRGVVNDHEVVRSIVKTVPVEVMDMLMGKEGASKDLLHHPSMLAHRLTVSRHIPVPQSVGRFIDALASAVKRVPAELGAKEPGLSTAPLPVKGETASQARSERGLNAGAATEQPPSRPAGQPLERTTAGFARKGLEGGSQGPSLEGVVTGPLTEGRHAAPGRDEARSAALTDDGSGHVVVHLGNRSDTVNIIPTDGQKEAGTYKKAHAKISGLDISIENPAGSTRSGTDATGASWSITMQDHYGYIRGTQGKDKEHVDVFLKPGTPEDYSGPVFVVDQNKNGTRTFDEHKVVLGAASPAEAREIYQRNYSQGWKGLGSISTFTMEQFKTWLEKGDQNKPAVDYKPGIQAEKDKLEAMRPDERKYQALADAMVKLDTRIANLEGHGYQPSLSDLAAVREMLAQAENAPADLSDGLTRELTSLRRAFTNILQRAKKNYYSKEDDADAIKQLLSGRDGKLPQAPDKKTATTLAVANYVESRLNQKGLAPGILSFTLAEVYKRADDEFGGTQAQGAYTPKDAFDAIELGVNQYILTDLYRTLPHDPMGTITKARVAMGKIRTEILDRIPGQQNRRTAEQDEFQQFSTPPDLAFAMALAAHIAPGETVLEPSAGLGGLAVFAHLEGASVYVNEYSDRRANILKTLPFKQTFTENAEQLNNILPQDVQPTVILMNPPFSSTAGRMQGQRKSAFSIAHLDQALKRLQPGGRLVALIGKGREAMGGETSKTVEEWIAAPGKTLRARIGVSGKNYKKYGTDYDNQILIFDKIESTGHAPVLANVEDVYDALPLLKEVRDARTHGPARPTEPTADQSGSETLAPAGEAPAQPGQPTPVSTDDVGTGPGRGPSLQGKPGPAGNSPGVRDRPAGESGAGHRPGVRPPGARGTGPQSDRGATQLPTDDQASRPGSPGSAGPSPDRAPGRLPTEGVDESIRVDQADNTTRAKSEQTDDDSVYEVYTPQKLKIAGAKPHPGELVESAAMAAVEPPAVTYQPKLPKALIERGKLSLAQLEAVVYAGQSHEHILPSGERQGFFIGDGTGVGKGREISGIILDNKNQGRTKAVWISKKSNLITDARRDWQGIEQDPTEIFDLSGRAVADAITQPKGILFTSYNTLISGLKSDRGGLVPSTNKKTGEANSSRLDQIVNWLGKDFDGVIAFDEAHAMQNASPSKGDRGQVKGSSTGLVGLELQKRLPNARIVYVSATGATEVANLAYAERLGLWGEGTAFPNRTSFIGRMVEGGLAAMEVVAQNIKAMGLYVARQLSYRGVTYERMEHKLTPKQREVYDEMARAWQIILNNINEALAATGGADDKDAKGAARGKLYGAQQRFFNQVLTSLQMPTVLESMQKQLDAGNAVVLQLVNTNEASQQREVDKVMAEEGDLEDVDITPREILMSYLRSAFPTAQMEEYLDESGKKAWRKVRDSKGNIVQNAEAVARREALMDRFGSDSFGVPDGVMEMVLDKFGEKVVAEVTGRKERLIRVTNPDTGDIERVHQKGRTVKVREADAKSFMDDKKQVLIFSDAGGTGMSYHADLASKNQRKRIHYLIQPGWIASNAVQGFGRTHRSNQKQPPHYVLVQTDLKGHKRFVSSVARRLDQMGAITKGQRQTGTQGFFNEEDNLEGIYSNAAIKTLILDIYRGRDEQFDWQGLIVERMGLDNLIDKRDGKFLEEKIPKTPKFLNRLLALEYTEQNAVFEAFQSRMQRLIRVAESKGDLDTGMETYRADSITLAGSEVVYTHPGTNAKAELQTFNTEHKVAFVPFSEATKFRHLIGFYKGHKTGKIVAALQPGTTHTQDDGEILTDILFRGPVHGKQTYSHTRALENGYTKLSLHDAEMEWKKAIQQAPTHTKDTLHLLTGTMLPIWDRLPGGLVRIIRVTSDAGKRVIGRRIAEEAINPTKKKLGADVTAQSYTPQSAIDTLATKGPGGKIRLANSWAVKRALVNGEGRYELTGDDLLEADSELQKAGVFKERIQFKTRWFLPSDRAAEVLTALTRHRAIVDVVGKTEDTEGRDGLASNQRSQPDALAAPQAGFDPPDAEAHTDPPLEEARAMEQAFAGKNVIEAADWIARSAPSPDYRLIAERVRNRLMAMQAAGLQFTLRITHLNERVPASLIGARGLTFRAFDSPETTVYLQGADVTGHVGVSYETALHEFLHAATQAALYVGNRRVAEGSAYRQLSQDLFAVTNAIVAHFNAKVKRGDSLTSFERAIYEQRNNALRDPDEVLAWGLTNRQMQAFLESVPYGRQTLWQKFVEAVRTFLGLPARTDTALSEVLRIADALMDAPIDQLMTMAKAVNLPTRLNQYEGLSSQHRADGLSDAQQSSAGLIDKVQAKDRLKAATTQARPYLLGSLGLHQLATVYGKDHQEVATYNQASQQMETDFVEITRESDEILQHWDKLTTTVADRMARVMEQARFANYDPDPQVNRAAPDDPKEQAIRDAFNHLSDEAKAVYREARDFYSAMADRRFNAIAGRIARSGGTPTNRKAAMDKLKLAYDQVRAKVYFPFTRFGEHIVIARQMVDGVEKDREVSAFESPLEAQQFATMMKARGWKVKQTLAKEYSRDQEGAASKAVREILDIVEGLDEQNPRAKDQLLDAINQTFIHALPDMSYAKHFTHAKDVKGFSKDALRAFAHSALHGAHHISRIQNADFLTRALASMDARINDEDEGDVTEARQVHNELTLRHNDLLNPNVSPVTAWLGQLGFTMSLGGVIATGVTNATQVPLVTLPWLGARYGFGKSGAHLARAYKDFLDPATLNSDSLFDASKSQRLTGAERAMLKELQRRGRIDLTQTMDLSGRASQDNLSRVARQHGSLQDKIAKMLGFTFHAPEVMNRQVTALATYRMEMTRTVPGERPDQKHDRAIAQAEAAIIDTHFIYTQENRPRYMSGNVMRVLTMFKQYGQNIAFLYGRSAQLWLTQTQATADEKAIAKKQLLSMAGLQFAAAGALGMPFVGTVASLFTALLNGFGDDDDKKEWEVELRKYLAEAVGKEAGEVLSHGVSRLTPWDMAARLGQSDLFFRAPQREREGRAAAMDWITSLSGPVLGYAVNAYLGVGDMAKGIQSADAGHFLRGVEEMTPALIRNQVKALRYEMEGGIQSRDHHHQLDVSGAETLGQFFGFAPSRGAEMYEGMTAIKNRERRLAGRRADLLDAYAAAYEAGDQEGRRAVMADVQEFNAKHRELAINGDTLLKSLRGRRKREAATEGGVYLPRKRDNLRQEGSFANY